MEHLREGEHFIETRGDEPAGLDIPGAGAARICCSTGSTMRGASPTVRSNSHRPHFGFAAHAQHLLGAIATHPDRFDAERGEIHYRKALALAAPRGMLPLVAHAELGLSKLHRRAGRVRAGTSARNDRGDDVSQHEHAVLGGAGRGGNFSAAIVRGLMVQPKRLTATERRNGNSATDIGNCPTLSPSTSARTMPSLSILIFFA